MNKKPSLIAQDSESGFTLIELMITVAIIAILAAIVLPNYKNYLIKAHRTDAQAAMLNLAQYMESQYNASFAYPDVDNIPPSLMSPTSISDYYTFNIDGECTSSQSFTITATPTTRQNDTQCETLALNEKGEKGGKYETDGKCKIQDASGCWK